MRENIKIKLLQNMLKAVTEKYDEFIREQNELLKITYRKATRDPLTGLYNRQFLLDYLEKAIEKTLRERNKSLLVFIDVDNLKCINDSFGHDMGDKILSIFAKLLQKHFRTYDILARIGGDEFIIFTESDKIDAIKERLLKIKRDLEKEIPAKRCNLSFSFGIVKIPDEVKSVSEILKLADYRMYQNKKKKKLDLGQSN